MKTYNRCSLITILALNGLVCMICARDCPWYEPQLWAVHNSLYAEQLYLRVRDEETPTDGEGLKHARLRQRVCHNITSSDYFRERNEYPVDEESIRDLLKDQHKSIYKMIFKWRKSSTILLKRSLSRRGRFYQNPYTLRKVNINKYANEHYEGRMTVEEHVFVCLTSGNHVEDIRAYYVSKEYDVSDITISPNECMVGRFIFSDTRDFEVLAEEAAWAYLQPEFNVELHYLKTRRHFQPVPKEEGALDPVCRMAINPDSPNNQWMRLCVSALGSLYFRTRGKYITFPRMRLSDDPCHYIEVSFRTEEARRKIESEQISLRYFEWMVSCIGSDAMKGDEVVYYVSRAYASNQVFVYGVDESERIVYPENLSLNISIVETDNVRLMRNQSRLHLSNW